MSRPRNLPRVFFAAAAVAFVLAPRGAQALNYRWTNVPFSSAVTQFSAVAVAPSDPSIVYAASARGFFASADAGETWIRRSDDMNVITIALDPTNPSTVWAGSAGGPFSPGGGLRKSSDGGVTWTLSIVTPTVGQFPVYAIAIDPTNPSTVFAGTSVGLYRTKDGGATWTDLTNGIPLLTNFFVVVMAPSSHSTIYAGSAFQTSKSGVYKSTDGGDTWVQLNSGVAISDVRSIAVDPLDANVAYRSDYSVGISKTTDGGAHWTLAAPISGVLVLAADPTSSSVVYGAINGGIIGSTNGRGLLRTADGGATWVHVENGIAGLVVLSLAIDPRNPSRLYAATAPATFGRPAYSGLLRSSDGGASWQPVPQPPLAVATVGPVTVDPKIPSTIFLGSMRSTDGGVTWQPIEPPGEFVVFDPRLGSTVYTGSPLRKSIDSGATWTPLPLTGLGASVVGFVIDPLDSAKLYAVSSNGVFSKSLDSGQIWTSTIFVQPQVSSLAADPAIAGVLYAGDGIGLFESRNAGESWARVEGPWFSIPSNPAGARVVGTDPSGHAVYVDIQGLMPGIYRSVDGGVTWAHVSVFHGIGLSAIAADPSTGALYAGTGAGILRSTDHGASWTSVSIGLPGAVTSIAVDRLSSTVWAVSNGFLYRATFQEDTSCSADDTILCLNSSRFRVRAAWRTAEGAFGDAHARSDTSDTGAFWFFSSNNIEVVVKVLDGRPANGHFWVFGAALTNVEYTLEIVDTETGALWIHHNTSGTLASFADTLAF